VSPSLPDKTVGRNIYMSLPAGLPRSGNQPVLNLLTGQKSGFSQGRLVAPIQVKLCRADGHVGPLGCAKFHLNHYRGWECGPKWQKFPLLV